MGQEPAQEATAEADVDTEDGVQPRIVKTKSFQMKPMTPEEAALQMDLLGHDFFFFMSAETERATVVYRRDDGDIGLIDQV
jgi:putative sigma-54 modulation protein